MERYFHHIAALATPHQEAAGKQPSLDRIIKGSATKVWSFSNANKWSGLLPNGVGKYRPESERIAGTGTIFFIHKL